MSGATGRRGPHRDDGTLRVAVVSRRVHPAHGPGGMERHVFDLVRHVAAEGIRVDLYTETPAEAGRATELSAALPPGVSTHLVPGRWLPLGRRPGTVVLDRITNYPLWTRRVGRWVRRVEEGPGSWTGIEVPPDDPAPPLALIHAHGLAGWGFAGGSGGLPLVLSPHGMEEFQVPAGPKRWGYAPFRAWMRGAAAAADVVVAMDRSLEPLVERHLGVEAGRRETLPNAVDTAALRAAADPDRGRELLARWGLAGAAPVFLSVGRVAPNKGYELMVRALARASGEPGGEPGERRGKPGDPGGAGRLAAGWGWVLVGDGSARRGVEAEARAAGLSRAVIAGRLPDADVRALCAVADWFVHPTRYEGSSIVTLEAMAHGLPVIASRTGGLPDKVEEGVTGFLVPPGDEAALAQALVRTREADARGMGGAGRELCEQRFSWEVVGRRYVRLYRRLAGEDTGRAAAEDPP